jgi:hypothetical protein
MTWDGGHILAALQSLGLVQHPPVRGDALALGDLGNLAVGAQNPEDTRQVQRLGRSRHLLGELALELGALRVNERVTDAACGAGRQQCRASASRRRASQEKSYRYLSRTPLT